MTLDAPDHDGIEELLAGYALQALEGEDAARADRLLADHVPSCVRCRETLADLRGLTGELALLAPPREPPETLLAALRRELAEPPVVRRRPVAAWVTAAAAMVVLGLSGWNAMLTQRVTRAEEFQSAMSEAFFTTANPASQTVQVSAEAQAPTRLYLAYLPDGNRMYLMGSGVPDPREGHVYWVWGFRDGTFVPIGAFLPHDGLVVLRIDAAPGAFEGIVIADEREGRIGRLPGDERWATRIG
ncbi:MAG: anti-sigma factor [Actinobacteria bacterium]|nr:anti-sigma factor [Actinomycetota bacterium]